MAEDENMQVENSIGNIHNKAIYEFLLKRGRKGAKPGEISKHVLVHIKGTKYAKPLSRTNSNIRLKDLVKQKKIYRQNSRYYVNDPILLDIYNFARSMKEACETIIQKSVIDASPDEKVPGQYTIAGPGAFRIEFFKALRDSSPSKQFCETKFDKNTLNEKYIFEFANRIGAYITYLLIESMRPVAGESEDSITKEVTMDENGNTVSRRHIVSSALLQYAIDIKSILMCFLNIIDSFSACLKNTTNTKSHTSNIDHSNYYELDKNDFDRLSKVFRNVYPGIYQALEKKWNYDAIYETDWLEHKEREGLIKCAHRWEETSIYKLGKFHFCRKCYSFISDNAMQVRKGNTTRVCSHTWEETSVQSGKVYSCSKCHYEFQIICLF
jgi:hypothetical protein